MEQNVTVCICMYYTICSIAVQTQLYNGEQTRDNRMHLGAGVEGKILLFNCSLKLYIILLKYASSRGVFVLQLVCAVPCNMTVYIVMYSVLYIGALERVFIFYAHVESCNKNKPHTSTIFYIHICMHVCTYLYISFHVYFIPF